MGDAHDPAGAEGDQGGGLPGAVQGLHHGALQRGPGGLRGRYLGLHGHATGQF